MGTFDTNFWSLTCGTYCSLWNLLDHFLPPGFYACHIPPSPRHVSQTLYPNKDSQSSSLGFPHISPLFTSPVSLPRFPGSSHCYPQAPGLKHQARTLLSSTSCVGAWSRGKENATLKPSPSHIFLAPWEEAACVPAAFFALFHLFSHSTVKKRHGTAGRASRTMGNERFLQEFLGVGSGRSQTWQCHP